ncbi:MAG TPA: hemerythrin [Clostridiaceae bacterium]|nr:hemerythrin [Clostridiaceae bacterium]
MSFLQWNDKYLTHVEEFDAQHKHLFSLINQIYERVLQCHTLEQEKAITQEILAELIRYAEVHFKAEETMLQQYGYPGLEEHVKEHDAFRRKVDEFTQEYRAKAAGLSTDVFVFMKDWITEHVLRTDIEYTSFLKEKNAR